MATGGGAPANEIFASQLSLGISDHRRVGHDHLLMERDHFVA